MKLFIWQREDDITSNWHPEAGIAIIAEDYARARLLIREHQASVKVSTKSALHEPNFVADMRDGAEECLFIFPDAGCC